MIVFPYTSIKRANGVSHKGPYIPIFIRHPEGKLLRFLALIDSGADSCVISKSTADLLQIKYGKEEETEGIGGKAKGCWGKFSFVIEGEHEKHIFNHSKVFILQDDLDVPILLGRNPFFDKFEISFVKNSKVKIRKAE